MIGFLECSVVVVWGCGLLLWSGVGGVMVVWGFGSL